MENLETELKIAIIGCGAIVENNHLPALSKIKNISVAWFADTDIERAKIYANRYRAGYSDNTDDIPNDIHAALVAVPNYLHADLCTKLMEKGIDVLCEKPMAITVSDCMQIVKSAEQNHSVFAVVHQLKFLSSVKEFKRIVFEESRLGNIEEADISLGWKFAWQSRTSFYSEQKYAGGGVMMDLGCHILDLAADLFGDINHAEMSASFNSQAGDRMDNAATLKVCFDSGVSGSIRVSRLGTLDNSILVKGKKGFISASLTDPCITLNISDSALCFDAHGAKIETGSNDPFAELWLRFAACCRNRKISDKLSGAVKGLRVIQIIESLYEKGIWNNSL